MKRSGRLGQAAIYGAGCHALPAVDGKAAVATCTTGTGEYLIRTGLAKVIAERVQLGSSADAVSAMDDAFLHSPALHHVPQPIGGVLVVSVDSKIGRIDCTVSHTAASMVAACMFESDEQPRIMEVVQPSKSAGLSVCSVACKILASAKRVEHLSLFK